MSKTFEQGREEVAKLCKYFAENRLDFFAAGVKEVGADPRSTNHPPTNRGGFDLSIPKGGACPSESKGRIDQEDKGRTQGSAPTKNRLSLPDVIRQFKTLTSKKYSDNVSHSNWTEFQKRLWQRNYFEHIIRSDKELDKIRQYIRDNPVAWPLDDENPEKQFSIKDEKKMDDICPCYIEW